nr:Gfo/Idh/MocA family oxidoreductase [Lewinella sp. 4G2]
MQFLVVGMGHIGRRHAALIAAHPEAQLLGVCDIRPATDLNWPDGLAGTTHYPSLEQALSRPGQFDVACICTPNGLHADQAVAALEAGLHVVIEKPIALTTEDAERIATAARKSEREVFGVMQNRYSPASAWLKSLLDQRRLGKVLQVHLDCFWNRDHRYYSVPDPAPAAAPTDRMPHPWHGHQELDGGVLYTQFAHFIDLLCWGFGEPTIDFARFANQNHEDFHDFADTGSVVFSLPGDVRGSLNFSTAIWDRNFESTLTVIGTKGTVKLGGQYMNDVRHCHVEDLDFPDLPASAPGNDYGGYTGSAANHHFVIDNVVDVLNGRAKVATPVSEGIAVVRAIEAMYNCR